MFLSNLLVEKGAVIWSDQLQTVREFPVDTRACQRFLQKQKECSGEESAAAKVLECLLNSIHRVTRAELFEGIEEVAFQLWDNLTSHSSGDTRFYIALSGDSRDMCFSKSTIFISIMMMAKIERLARSFQGFVCRGQLLDGAAPVSSAIKHIVYADDASFSGLQLTDGIEDVHIFCLNNGMDPLSTTLHLPILFISPQTRQKVVDSIPRFERSVWYIPQHQRQPQPVVNALNRMPAADADRNQMMSIAHEFLNHDDLYSDGVEHVLGKPMFYTDLKMPDQMSSHPHFLLDPGLSTGERLGESLVFGCFPPRDSDTTRRMMSGLLCPVPCYKREGWYDSSVVKAGEDKQGHKNKRQRRVDA